MSETYDTDDGKEAERDDAPDVAPEEWEEIHEQAMEEYERGWERERLNISDAFEDLKFRRGRQEDQWDSLALQQRAGRPCHTINLLPKFIRQVTGDMRKMRPSMKAVPVDSRGDPDTAETLSGMFRYIENRSYAKHVYTTANDSQVCCGIGHWQVMSEYASSTTFNQELRIAGIEDGVSVIWDADSIMPTREDAMHCFVPMDMTAAAFKKRWPDAKADGFDTREGEAFNTWATDEHIRVATYWKKETIKRTLALMGDGSIEDLTKKTEGLPKKALRQFIAEAAARGIRVEQRDSFKVCRYMITQAEILEETEWKGLHIPIVPVIGEEIRIGHEVYRHGIVRYARDLQRMVNYYASAETEVVALQPKSPWIVSKKMVEKHYDQWENANTENLPFLEFDIDPANPSMKPERVQPPAASQAIQLGGVKAAEDMKAVIGIYDAALGAKSNETSGIAIERRDAQSDTGTFVYLDNSSLAIQRTAQIVLDLIPHYYDTQRMIQIIGDDGKPSLKTINQPMVQNGEDRILNDVTVGAYDVVMEQGPGYATKREEAAASMSEFIRAFPPAAPLIGDIFAKVQDWPHHDEIGERLEEALPPAIKNKLQQERKQADMKPGEPPPPPTPEEQAAAQAQAMAQQVQQLELADKKADVDKKQAETAKIRKEAGIFGAEGPTVQDQMDKHLAEIELASKEDDFNTARQINALNVAIKEAELVKARSNVGMSAEKHDISMVKDMQNLGHTAQKHSAGMFTHALGAAQGQEKHQAGMTAQAVNAMQGQEKHQASIDGMQAEEAE